ncbi:hypothetical protein EDB89DRAFT_2072541 [Lactarius sanguifluus]|nr:hypothetical protein EDB89DRAFT_2072541 [Lactarius sanguifluus]
MEQFLSAIPGFYNSSWVKRDVPALEKLNGKRLAPAIATFMDNSLSSGLLTEPEKWERVTICTRAMNADPLLLQCTLRQTLQTLNSDIFRRIDFVRFALQHLRRDDSDSDRWIKDYVQCIVAVAINRVQPDDDAWIDIIRGYLDPQHSRYRQKDDIRLCNLMQLTRWLVTSRLKDSDQFEQGGVWRNVLTEVRKKAAPELQHLLCLLWNELTDVAQGRRQASESRMARSNATHILSIIRTVYVPLHEDTNSATVKFSSSTGYRDPVLRSPSSYPLCTVDSHQLDSRAHIYDSAPTTSIHPTPRDSAALPTPSASPEASKAVIPGPSRRPFGADDTGDHLPHPLFSQYDDV